MLEVATDILLHVTGRWEYNLLHIAPRSVSSSLAVRAEGALQ